MIGNTWPPSGRLLALPALLLFASQGCAPSTSPAEHDPDALSAADTSAPRVAADARTSEPDGVREDAVMPAADAVAPDAGSRSRDAEARDAAPVRAEAPPLEASAVRSEAPGQEIADTRADRAALDLKPVPDGASPEGPAGDATDPGADSGETACKLDGSAAAMAHLTPLELKTLLDSSEDPFLINVKGASIDDIPGTDAVLANDLPGIEALVGRDHCANIVLYCASGMTSQSVGGQLIANGYLRVRDLAGGIKAWTNAGYPTQ